MIRKTLNERLKEAVKSKDVRATSTLRLILAALKDRDIAARSKGNQEGIADDEIMAMLQTMVKQRRDSIEYYRRGGREDLAVKEEAEIAIIERFLPQQMSEAEVSQAIGEVSDEVGATGIKDMGKVMAALRERYAGRMDFARVSGMVRERLG